MAENFLWWSPWQVCLQPGSSLGGSETEVDHVLIRGYNLLKKMMRHITQKHPVISSASHSVYTQVGGRFPLLALLAPLSFQFCPLLLLSVFPFLLPSLIFSPHSLFPLVKGCGQFVVSFLT